MKKERLNTALFAEELGLHLSFVYLTVEPPDKTDCVTFGHPYNQSESPFHPGCTCPMQTLTISTCMAPNMDYFARDVAEYLASRLGARVDLRVDVPWQEREQMLDAGQLDLCWICGLPYVRKADARPGSLIPLAAPVMRAPRYQNQPIYFSDVVVRRGSPFQRLEDLLGAVWAYNEPGSHSGYGVVRYTLAVRGTRLNMFGRVIKAGSHQNALGMIVRGEVDAAAIDSTVLEQEMRDRPALTGQIRVIDIFGPSPIPPWVAPARLPAELRETLRSLLMEMHTGPAGRALLERAAVARFAPVDDTAYAPIRAMARLAFGE